MYPVEYNTFGNGSLNNLSMKYVDFNGNIAWYKEYKIFDHLGNVRSVLRKSSADNNNNTYSVVAQYDYDAWGGVIWSSVNNERAKYIGKETDNESGDHNHGVRQYSDYVGRFLCPDGLWAKYVGWTPYQYAGNNPINSSDGNGLLIEYVGSEEEQKYSTEKFNQALNYLQNNGATEAVGKLTQLRDDPNFTVKFYANTDDDGFSNSYKPSTKFLLWNPETAMQTSNANLSPAEVLAHEVDHAIEHNTNPEQYQKDRTTPDDKSKNKEEKRAIDNETKTAKELNHLKDKDKPTRDSHTDGTPIKVTDVDKTN